MSGIDEGRQDKPGEACFLLYYNERSKCYRNGDIQTGTCFQTLQHIRSRLKLLRPKQHALLLKFYQRMYRIFKRHIPI